ncbi:MAG: Gfo/Idh/MocA family protein [Candidatus Brocadiia bacterium]
MKTLKTAVVGCGLFGENHLRSYTDYARARCAAVHDLDRERARAMAEKYGVEVADSLEDIAADKTVKAVSVATPDFAHTDIALQLLEAGKHLLIEKPITTSAAEACQIVDLAAKKKRTVMVDFHNRWNPAFAQLKKRIDAGELGQPVMAYARLSNPLSIPFGMLSWSGRSGPQWFLYPHIVDIVRWLAGRPRALRVHAVGRKGVLQRRGCDAYDAIQATVTFEGCFATFETCWILPESWPNVIDFRVELVGEESTGQVVATSQGLLFASKKRFETPFVTGLVEHEDMTSGWMLLPMRHFVDCVLEGRQPIATAEDGLAATQIIEGAIRSVEEGRIVEIDEV